MRLAHRRAMITNTQLSVFLASVVVALGAAGCETPIQAVPTMATTTQGLAVCWSPPDEGDAASGTGELKKAVGARLGSAGYRLVTAGHCDLRLSWDLKSQEHNGTHGYREVTLIMRDGKGTFVDRAHMEFLQWDVPVAEPDRLAILMVNAVNASAKVATLHKGPCLKPARASDGAGGPLAVGGSTWTFEGSKRSVTFNADGTVTSEDGHCGPGNWSQTGDHVVFDCNKFTVYDIKVSGSQMAGEWHRAKDPDALGNRGETCLERQ
jgi:hypothetical protein